MYTYIHSRPLHSSLCISQSRLLLDELHCHTRHVLVSQVASSSWFLSSSVSYPLGTCVNFGWQRLGWREWEPHSKPDKGHLVTKKKRREGEKLLAAAWMELALGWRMWNILPLSSVLLQPLYLAIENQLKVSINLLAPPFTRGPLMRAPLALSMPRPFLFFCFTIVVSI